MAMYVVGLFDNTNDAQTAVRDLESAGFENDSITLDSGNGSGTINRLTSVGVPEDDANAYAEGVRRGGSLVTVYAQTEDQAYQAADIINRYNNVDIANRGQEYRQSGWSRFDESLQPYDTTAVTADTAYTDTAQTHQNVDTESVRGTEMRSDVQQGEEMAVPIVEEDLRVGKREVERGGVRVTTRIEETPIEEQVRVRDETINIERRRVDRPVSEVDAAAFQEGTFEVREQDEEVVVDKQARVVEEVVIDKDVEQRTETVHDTVRRTEVDVEDLSGQSTISGYSEASRASTTDYRGMESRDIEGATDHHEPSLTDRIENATGLDIDRDDDVAGRKNR